MPSMLERLTRRASPAGAGLYAAVLCFTVLSLCGAAGLALRQPWLFPSLGPTVMLFFESPGLKGSRPRDALFGHAVALAAGIGCTSLFGLQDGPPAAAGLTPAHVAAGALSVAVTTFILTRADMPHPPAGATTLIVSLGVLLGPAAWLSMAGAVLLTTGAGWGLNLLLGVHPLRGRA